MNEKMPPITPIQPASSTSPAVDTPSDGLRLLDTQLYKDLKWLWKFGKLVGVFSIREDGNILKSVMNLTDRLSIPSSYITSS